MARPLPLNIELLIWIGNQSGYSYEQTYATWCRYHTHLDSHLVVETIFHIARSRKLPIGLAQMAFDGRLSQYSPN